MFQNPTVGSLGWFARHEFNLSWRDFVRMMSAGKPGREKAVILFLAIAVLITHAIAYMLLTSEAGFIDTGSKSILLTISGCIALTFSLMMSQAMELVTRTFYSRSDLDLVLSSPTNEKRVFAVRIGAIAVATSMLPMLLFGSVINTLAIFDTPSWLAGYLLIFGFGSLATAMSLAIAVLMFKTLGAKKTRLATQIIAAIVGAGFIIGVQIAAIVSLDSVSRVSFFQSDMMLEISPGLESMIWLPARAATGEVFALVQTLFICLFILGSAILLFAPRFGEYVIEAAGIGQTAKIEKSGSMKFRQRSVRSALIFKEWKLLLRDHWLISQSLMQILYLVPPAFMLWRGFGSAETISGVALPILVMAAGQLAGGLAWLAISGEDAPQLVQTAPVPKGMIIRAKVEAVLGAIGILVFPILLLIAFMDLMAMVIAALGIAAATISATMIQLWFRSQANRASFRRRQTSSKVATFSEAFSSIMWAGATGLVAAGYWVVAPVLIALALLVLWIARSFRPEQDF
ncbi:MAG: permease [Rhizobiaceae bacterium]|nr:permease [Rhizobiaceae bacterium]